MEKSRNMLIRTLLMGEIVTKYPDAIYALMDCGMGCVGCPASQGESLNDAAMVHGLNPDDARIMSIMYWRISSQARASDISSIIRYVI